MTYWLYLYLAGGSRSHPRMHCTSDGWLLTRPKQPMRGRSRHLLRAACTWELSHWACLCSTYICFQHSKPLLNIINSNQKLNFSQPSALCAFSFPLILYKTQDWAQWGSTLMFSLSNPWVWKLCQSPLRPLAYTGGWHSTWKDAEASTSALIYDHISNC